MSKYSRTFSALAVVAGLALVGGTMPAAQAAPAEFKYKTYKVPTANSELGSITVGGDGNLWFTEGREIFTPNADPNTGGTFSSNIGRITPTGTITEFRVEGGGFPHDIVQGPRGLLYFSDNQGLGSITLAGQVQPFIQTPPGLVVGGNDLARDGDNIWLTSRTLGPGSLWRYNTTNRAFTEFPIAGTAGPSDVAVDSSRNIWFGAVSESGQGYIGRLDPAGNITTVDVQGTPNQVSIATDGKIWFTDRFNSTVGYVDPVNGNNVQQFPTPTPDAGPQGITAAANGVMWFTQARIGNAARVTAGGAFTEAGKAVGDDPNSGLEAAQGITVLPGAGSVWFTMPEANKIASLK